MNALIALAILCFVSLAVAQAPCTDVATSVRCPKLNNIGLQKPRVETVPEIDDAFDEYRHFFCSKCAPSKKDPSVGLGVSDEFICSLIPLLYAQCAIDSSAPRACRVSCNLVDSTCILSNRTNDQPPLSLSCVDASSNSSSCVSNNAADASPCPNNDDCSNSVGSWFIDCTSGGVRNVVWVAIGVALAVCVCLTVTCLIFWIWWVRRVKYN